MSLIGATCLLTLLPLSVPRAIAGDTELTAHVGLRLGGDVDAAGIDVDTDDVGPSFGLTWDQEYRTNRWLWTAWSFQSTELEAPGLLPDRDTIDLDIHYLHVGTSYRGKNGDGKGFVMFGLGATWIDPPPEFDAELGASLAVGGGFRIPLRPTVAFRFDARGYLTFTDSELSGVCGGKACTLDFSGAGAFQVDLLAGLTFSWRR